MWKYLICMVISLSLYLFIYIYLALSLSLSLSQGFLIRQLVAWSRSSRCRACIHTTCTEACVVQRSTAKLTRLHPPSDQVTAYAKTFQAKNESLKHELQLKNVFFPHY